MSPCRASALAAALSLAFGVGCRAGALVIGEAAPGGPGDGAVVLGADDGGGDDGATTFVTLDGGDAGDGGEACTSLGGSCAPSTAVCARSSAASCGSAALRCCLPDCPISQNPPADLCDGGPIARLFSKTGCELGFACAPVDCATANGTCGAEAACALSQRTDAATYSCSTSASPSDVCCLP